MTEKKNKFEKPSDAATLVLKHGGEISLKHKTLIIGRVGLKVLAACDYVCKTYNLKLLRE
jgi:hypothetical protein